MHFTWNWVRRYSIYMYIYKILPPNSVVRFPVWKFQYHVCGKPTNHEDILTNGEKFFAKYIEIPLTLVLTITHFKSKRFEPNWRCLAIFLFLYKGLSLTILWWECSQEVCIDATNGWKFAMRVSIIKWTIKFGKGKITPCKFAYTLQSQIMFNLNVFTSMLDCILNHVTVYNSVAHTN